MHMFKSCLCQFFIEVVLSQIFISQKSFFNGSNSHLKMENIQRIKRNLDSFYFAMYLLDTFGTFVEILGSSVECKI